MVSQAGGPSFAFIAKAGHSGSIQRVLESPPRVFHHKQPVCAITDFPFAIPENELCFAQADVCPSPEAAPAWPKTISAFFDNLKREQFEDIALQ
jgi:hypothetical protein